MKPLVPSLLIFLFSPSLFADIPPVEIGPAARLAAFHTGAPGNDFAMGVVPHDGGFTVVTQHRAEIRSIEVDSVPPPLYTQPRLDSQKHLLESTEYSSLFELSLASSTARGVMTATNDVAGILVSSAADGGSRTRIGGKTAAIRAFGCNALRCALRYDDVDPRLAILDDSAQVLEDFRFPFDPVSSRSIAADPTGFLMFYSSGGGVRARRLDLSGAVTFDVALPDAMLATFAGDRYEVVTRDGSSVLHTESLSPTGQTSSVRDLGTTGDVVKDLACNDAACVALEETIVGVCDCIPVPVLSPSVIHAIRFDRTGSASPKIIDLAPDPSANLPGGIAWNGNAFYAAWTHSGNLDPSTAVVRGALISPSGDVLSRDGLSASTLDQTPNAMARQGGITVAAWSETNQLTGITDLHATRLDGADAVIDDRIVAHGDSATATSIVPLGTDFLLLWSEHTVEAHGAILRADGSVWPVDFAGIPYEHAAASRDHWLLAARGLSGQTRTALLTRGGILTPGGVVPALSLVTAMASDGDRFALLQGYVLRSSTAAETPIAMWPCRRRPTIFRSISTSPAASTPFYMEAISSAAPGWNASTATAVSSGRRRSTASNTAAFRTSETSSSFRTGAAEHSCQRKAISPPRRSRSMYRRSLAPTTMTQPSSIASSFRRRRSRTPTPSSLARFGCARRRRTAG
jgi:hypothetical protein